MEKDTSALVAFLHSMPHTDYVDLARALIIIQLSLSPRAPLTSSRLPEIKHFNFIAGAPHVRPSRASSPPHVAILRLPSSYSEARGFLRLWRSQLSICLRLRTLFLPNQADIIAPQTPARSLLFPP